MAKSRTYNKFWNGIISCIRTNFARYSPKYDERLKRNRVELEKTNKDGSVSKKKYVYYKCDGCDQLTKQKEINIDHIEPVVEIGKSSHDYTLDKFLSRLDCDIENLQVLCKKCHDEKSANERELRKVATAKTKGKVYPPKSKAIQKRIIKNGEKYSGYTIDDYVWCEGSKQYIHKSVWKGQK